MAKLQQHSDAGRLGRNSGRGRDAGSGLNGGLTSPESPYPARRGRTEQYGEARDVKRGHSNFCCLCGSLLNGPLNDGQITMAGPTLYCGQRRIRLSPSQAQIMQLLLRRLGRPVSLDEIGYVLWGGGEGPLNEHGTIRQQLHILRQRLRLIGWDILLAGYRGGWFLSRIQ